MNHTRYRRFSGLCLVLGLASVSPADAQSAPAAAQSDTSLIGHFAQQARAKSDSLMVGQRLDQRTESQYREGLAELERGAFPDAALSFQAALQRARNNAKIRGDLAYAYARAGDWDEAHTAFVQAYQSLQTNRWYLLGAAASKAQQRAWADAAGTLQLAVQSDSSLIDARLAREAAMWFQLAGDNTQALAWSRMAVARDSTDGRSWLRIAAALNARNDTSAEAGAAIRRAVALLPEDRLANGLYAGWLFQRDLVDSALGRAAYSAEDSTYREFAAHLHLEAGRVALGQRDVARSRRLLNTGLPWASASQRPGYANLIGRGDLLRATAMLQNLEERANCDSARVADTLLTSVERHLTEGLAYDSTRTSMLLTQVLPNYRTQARQLVDSACRTPAPQRRPPARRRP